VITRRSALSAARFGRHIADDAEYPWDNKSGVLLETWPWVS
jgi:hypothetical protein